MLEFGGGYVASEISDCFATNLGIGPGFKTPALTPISVDGGINLTTGANKSAEVTPDIPVARAVVQGANMAFCFAPFTEQGWVDIVNTAKQNVSKMPVAGRRD